MAQASVEVLPEGATQEPKVEDATHPDWEIESMAEQDTEPKQEVAPEAMVEVTDQWLGLSVELPLDEPKQEEATQPDNA